MKLSKLFLIATMVGSLAVIGCSDDGGGAAGSGGTAGTGGNAGTGGSVGEICPADADEICANCSGQQLNDCQADVFACNAFDDNDLCEACILESEPGCP